MFAQRAPGKARSGSGDDSRSARLRWFVEALDVFGEQAGFGAGGRTGEGAAVAMPYLIGCGLAGGHWPDYRAALEAWAESRGVNVRLYDRDDQASASS